MKTTSIAPMLVLAALAIFMCYAKVALAAPTWVRAKSGEIVYNPHPQPNETVVWSGGADAEGFASGHGVLIWVVDGQPVEALIGTMSRGKHHGRVVRVGPNNEISLLQYREGALLTQPNAADGMTGAQRESLPPAVTTPALRFELPRFVQPSYSTTPRQTQPAPSQTPTPYVPNLGGLSDAERARIKRVLGGLSDEERDDIKRKFGGLGGS